MAKSEIKTKFENSPICYMLELPPYLQQLLPVMVMVVCRNIETNIDLYLDHNDHNLNTSGDESVETYKRNVDYCSKQLQDSVKQIPSHVVEKVSL